MNHENYRSRDALIPDGTKVYYSDPDGDINSGYYHTAEDLRRFNVDEQKLIAIMDKYGNLLTVKFQELTLNPLDGIRRVVIAGPDIASLQAPYFVSVNVEEYLLDLPISDKEREAAYEQYCKEERIMINKFFLCLRERWDQNA